MSFNFSYPKSKIVYMAFREIVIWEWYFQNFATQKSEGGEKNAFSNVHDDLHTIIYISVSLQISSRIDYPLIKIIILIKNKKFETS